jgi:3-phenylpropionate/trans-cinnamate dioxygenase ferredoxin component
MSQQASMSEQSVREQAVSGDLIEACRLRDVPEDGTIHVDLRGRPVAIVRAEGRVFAIHDVCSHEEVPLSEGEVDGTTLECWLHGSRFDLETGEPIGLPATQPVPTYPTEIDGAGEDAIVYVRLEK